MELFILIQWFCSFLLTIKADETEICSLDKDGKPPRPRMILLGETGVGKSSFGNRLFQGYSESSGTGTGYSEDYTNYYDYEKEKEEVVIGHEGSLVMKGSYLEKAKIKEFGVGHTMESHTNETVWKTGKWLGTGKCMTVIDTQGMQDTQNRSCRFTREIGNVVRDLGEIDVFILIFKSESTRFTHVVREQLNTFQQLFGRSFWKRTMIEISFFSHDKRSRKTRRGGGGKGRNVQMIKKSWDKTLREELYVPYDVPVVFIDSHIPDGEAEQYEVEMFKNETSKAQQFMSVDTPYKCLDSSCANQQFTEGIPIFMDMERQGNRILAREHSSTALRFQIWFAEDCQSYDNLRNYEILKNNETIFTMVEEKKKKKERTKGGFRKLRRPTSLFPTMVAIEDECGEITKEMKCDYEKSKWKYVTIRFNNIHLDNFGQYQIKNIIGKSEPVKLVQTVDGGWTEWTEWSSCSKTCFSKDMEHGRRTRTRTCDNPTPQDNGDHCLGNNTEVSSCAPEKMCLGSWVSWSPWTPCSESCGKGFRTRSRTCSDGECSDIEKKGHISTHSGGTFQIDENCNPHDCPKSPKIGKWTKWKCNKVCFNGRNEYFGNYKDNNSGKNANEINSESRSRSCKDFPYFNGINSVKHPDPHQRCENIIQSQSERGCLHTKMVMCPTLGKLEITVGRGTDDGTNDWVALKFKNGDNQTCMTDYLNRESSNSLYNPGSVVRMTNVFGGCDKDFRPDDKLWVQIEVWRKGGLGLWLPTAFGGWDGYRFLKIEATFAKNIARKKPGSSVWKSSNTGFCDGCGSGYSKWFPMKKTYG